MGQYFKVVNISKKQYIHPHTFGDGLKLKEFGASGMGTMQALAVLLASGMGRGSGDLHTNNPIVGSWAGDRIVIAGDYADTGIFVDAAYSEYNLYIAASQADNEYEDISLKVLAALFDDPYFFGAFIAKKSLSFISDTNRDELIAKFKSKYE
jgi:hypothetical protein